MVTILNILDARMPRPLPFGWFHLSWLAAALLIVFLLRRKTGEHITERVFAVYGWTALILEALKQFSWSFTVLEGGAIAFDYQFYAAPFQLCTTPAYVCALYGFLKSRAARAAVRAYLAYFTLLASIAVALLPTTIFTTEVLVNIHTSFLHMGGLCVSLWLLASGRVDAKKDFLSGYKVFLIFVAIAQSLNLSVYHLFSLGERGLVFDMFFISPYYVSSLMVFDQIDRAVPFPVFMAIYLFAFFLGGSLVAGTRHLTRLIAPHPSASHSAKP